MRMTGPRWRTIAAAVVCVLAGKVQAAAIYVPEYRDPLTEPWRWRSFPELNGLGAQCIGEGPGGTLWFGTPERVWCFDGITWKGYSEEDGAGIGAVTLCRGVDGTMYAGTRYSIYAFKDGKWSALLTLKARTGELRKLMMGRDGTLWGATTAGLLRWGGDEHWTMYTSREGALRVRANQKKPEVEIGLIPEAVMTRPRGNSPAARREEFWDVCEDGKGRIWVGTESGEILCTTPPAAGAVATQHGTTLNATAAAGDWTLYNETDGVVGGRRPSIAALQNGEVWVVFDLGSGYVSMFDGAGWKKTNLSQVGMPTEGANLMQTRDGTVWFAGKNTVAACRGGVWKSYQRPEFPIPGTRNMLLETSDGALWVGGPSTEVYRIDYETPRWMTLRDMNFQWESPEGAQWFLHRDGRAVVKEGAKWTSYGPEDGMIDTPVALIGTRTGDVWAAGSHGETAATACFSAGKWKRQVHNGWSWGIDWRGVMESSDGSLWFSAAVDSSARSQKQGLLQFRDGQWIHHHQPGRGFSGESDSDLGTLLPATQRPEPIGKFYCLGESRGGRMWAGRNILISRTAGKWDVFVPPEGLRLGIIETLFTTASGEMWLGSRQFGAYRFDGTDWKQFQGSGSLVANSVLSFAETSDKTLWVATDRGVSRFDGRTWTDDMVPDALVPGHETGILKGAAGGRLWINRFPAEWMMRGWPKGPKQEAAGSEFWTVCHQFQGIPPQTVLTMGPKSVSAPGNVSVLWDGIEPWRETKESRLQFSYRLDETAWSAYGTEKGRAFFSLPPGPHRLEVRARDWGFNVDPTPAVLEFEVLPPVWRQPWFMVLTGLLVAAVGAQTVRVLVEKARLRKAHDQLEERVRERTSQLEGANKELEAFSYSVSHDLRAPLRAVLGFAQILDEEYAKALPEEAERFVGIIKNNAVQMGKLIDDLLAFSRMGRQPVNVQRVEPEKLIAPMVVQLRQEAGDRRVEVAVKMPTACEADPALLNQVFFNLLSNAFKYSRPRDPAVIEVGEIAGTTPDEVVYYVKDNGVGFDPKYAGKLFGVFQRLHRAEEFEGTGVGLATVQRIVARHGGRVWAESEVDKGATFYVALRRAKG